MRTKERFKIIEFKNRGGSKSWRVTGSKRDGSRIRENFDVQKDATLRRIELEAEFHAGHSETAMRATKLSHEQVQLAEVACIKLGDDWPRLLDAVDKWIKDGKQAATSESPRIDEAVTQFTTWLDKESGFRDRTQANLKARVEMFGNGIRNLRVAEITPETIEAYLGKRNVEKATKDNDRRALSRFFSWCIVSPQKWISGNPAKKQVRERLRQRDTLPAVLTVSQCEGLLRAAERYREGRLVPYVALCLFGGLRPEETARLTQKQVNLKDREIVLEPWQTKTGRSRLVKICDTLAAWLEACEGKELYPANWRKDFDVIKKMVGFGPTKKKDAAGKLVETGLKKWPEDVLRHTGISHYFRNCGSYGRTAEQFGNSEAVIKNHYQGRVSTEDAEKFYALRPGGAK
jgi:Site-specific recombinase XerD